MSRPSVLPVILAVTAPLLACPATSRAQESAASFPSKPVTAIAAFAAGGPNDKEMRAESDKLQELLGQQFIIDYKTSGNIAAAYVARSRPDGYTLLVNLGSFTTNPALYRDLPFDTLKDFAPITLASKKPFIFVVRPGFAA